MLEFLCPTCGKRVQGDDSFAGKTVVCPGCNATVTAPITAIATPEHLPSLAPPPCDTAISEGLPPQETPLASLRMAAPHAFRRWLPYFLVASAVLLAVGLLIPAVQKAREASARTQSICNLKQISLAMLGFHEDHKRIPFNGTGPAAAGDPKSGSWAFQILPYIDQQALFGQPNDNVGIAAFMCPGRGRPLVSTTGPWTDYSINPWLNDPKNGAANAPDSKITLRDIIDGTWDTIFAGHGNVDPALYAGNIAVAQSTDIFKGGDPALARRLTANQPDTNGDTSLAWGGPFPEGSLMAWCDGTVRLVPYTVTGGNIVNGISTRPNEPIQAGVHMGGFGAHLTPNGSEAVNRPD